MLPLYVYTRTESMDAVRQTAQVTGFDPGGMWSTTLEAPPWKDPGQQREYTLRLELKKGNAVLAQQFVFITQ